MAFPLRRRDHAGKPAAKAEVSGKNSPNPAPTGAPVLSKKKLSYKEQRERDGLPALIETLEQEQRALQGELADGSLYARDAARAAQLAERSGRIDDELLEAMERLEALGGA